MGTAIKHPMPGRVKPSFVIFDIRALWRSGLTSARRSPMYFSEQVSKHRWRRSESTSVHDNRHQEEGESNDERRSLNYTMWSWCKLWVARPWCSKAQILSDKATIMNKWPIRLQQTTLYTTQAPVNHIHMLYCIDCPQNTSSHKYLTTFSISELKTFIYCWDRNNQKTPTAVKSRN